MDWKEIANFGVVFLVLAAFAVAVWRVCVWVGVWLRSKLDPIAEAHLSLIRTLQEHAPKQTTAMEAQAHALEEIERSHREQNAMLLKINSNSEEAVRVEGECVKNIIAVSNELQKQTVELQAQTRQSVAQTDSLDMHRKELEKLLATKLPANNKSGEVKT